MTYEKPVNILLVEDNPTDIEITKEAFSLGKVKNKLYCVRDGQEALDFLYHMNDYSDTSKAPRPGLILLEEESICLVHLNWLMQYWRFTSRSQVVL